MKTLFLLSFLFTVSAHAQTKINNTFAHQKSTCKVGNQKVEFFLASPNKNMTTDEKDFGFSHLWVRSKGKTELAFENVDGKPNQFKFYPARKTTYCDGAFAFPTQNNEKLILLIVENNRPLGETLGFVYLDLKSGKIQFKDRQLGDANSIETTKEGFKFKTQLHRPDITTHKTEVRGKDAKVAEEDFNYWKKVEFTAEEFKVSLDRDQSFKRNEYGRYFLGQDDFEKAMGLNSEGTDYLNTLVMFVASFPEDPSFSCIQPSSVRQVNEDKKLWYCNDMKRF